MRIAEKITAVVLPVKGACPVSAWSSDAQRDRIGPSVELFSCHLLGRHVRDSPERHAVRRQISGLDGSRRHAGLVGDELGQSKVEHLHGAAVDQEQIRRLDVAMDDAALVRAVERVRHLNSEVDHIVGLERRAREAIAQVSAPSAVPSR